MKKLLLFLIMLTINFVSFAQNSEPEKVKPMKNTEIVRKCASIDIEGEYHENVKVTIKSKDPDFFTDKYRVKITVTDSSGFKIWDKTFKDAYLYIFSNGQIQVGKPNFDKLVISKSSQSNNWTGVVGEKEGVY